MRHPIAFKAYLQANVARNNCILPVICLLDKIKAR